MLQTMFKIDIVLHSLLQKQSLLLRRTKSLWPSEGEQVCA